MNQDLRTAGDHLYVAVLLPFDRQMKVDEQAYRRFLRHFLDNSKFVRRRLGCAASSPIRSCARRCPNRARRRSTRCIGS